MPTMPVGLDWDAVVGSAATFLGSTLVVGGLVAVLSLRFVPKFVRAIRSVVR